MSEQLFQPRAVVHTLDDHFVDVALSEVYQVVLTYLADFTVEQVELMRSTLNHEGLRRSHTLSKQTRPISYLGSGSRV